MSDCEQMPQITEDSKYINNVNKIGRKSLALGLISTSVVLGLNQTMKEASAHRAEAIDSPAGKMIHNFVLSHTDLDPEVEKRALQGFNSFSEIGEMYLNNLPSQNILGLTIIKKNPKKIQVLIKNQDSEAVYTVDSNKTYVRNNNEIAPIPYIHQFDTDVLFTNPRSLRAYRVSKFKDWKNPRKWKPVSNRVIVDAWDEQNIDSTMPSIDDGLIDFVANSKKTYTSKSEVKLNKLPTKKQLRLGLFALQVTQTWNNKNSQDGDRNGKRKRLWLLSTGKKKNINYSTQTSIVDELTSEINYLYTPKKSLREHSIYFNNYAFSRAAKITKKQK